MWTDEMTLDQPVRSKETMERWFDKLLLWFVAAPGVIGIILSIFWMVIRG